jgi:uncharacterized membrane protein YkoI
MVLRSLILSAVLIGTTAAATPGDARPPRDREQEAAMRGLQEGRILPLRAIEAMVVPRMRGFDYLGPEFDGASGRYRLKFLGSGQVVWIDVDARTGQVLGRSGR